MRSKMCCTVSAWLAVGVDTSIGGSTGGLLETGLDVDFEVLGRDDVLTREEEGNEDEAGG